MKPHGLFGEPGTDGHEAAYRSGAQVPQRSWDAGRGSGGKGVLNLLNSLKFTQWLKSLMDPDKGGPWPVITSSLFREEAMYPCLASLTAGISIISLFKLKPLSSERGRDLPEAAQLSGASPDPMASEQS